MWIVRWNELMVMEAQEVQSWNNLPAPQSKALRAYVHYSSTMLTENMCPNKSIFQRAPEGMDVCLFTSPEDLSEQSLQGPCSHAHSCAPSEQLRAGLSAA